MGYRKRTRKPTVALWTLVAAGDVALVLASVGVVVLVSLISVAAVVVVGVAAARYARPQAEPVPVRVPVRRGVR